MGQAARQLCRRASRPRPLLRAFEEVMTDIPKPCRQGSACLLFHHLVGACEQRGWWGGKRAMERFLPG